MNDQNYSHSRLKKVYNKRVAPPRGLEPPCNPVSFLQLRRLAAYGGIKRYNMRYIEILNNNDILNTYKSRGIVLVECDMCSRKKPITKKSILEKVKRGYKNFYCDNKCNKNHKDIGKRIETNCASCNKVISKTLCEINSSSSGKVFCSKSCSAKINNIGKQKNKPKKRRCNNCGQRFICSSSHRSPVLCSICSSSYKRQSETAKQLTINDYINRPSIKGKHQSWKYSHIRVLNRSWNKELSKLPCQVCGYDKHVELAHIKPISSFGLDTKLGEVNNPKNIVVLCPNHHWELDKGLINIRDIPPRCCSYQNTP